MIVSKIRTVPMKTQTQSVYIIEGLCCSVEPGELKTHAQTRDRWDRW